ncbi:protein CutA homolog isoform X3 [Dermacentor silvarum]|uniref:protein CutA homolog isoform X3 n=1 Tax=Dermacentor silvarum TaxID=543639 RepID=UPI00210174D5|nr:protein CutA homolog isoform X3 [Dermacentor silvarum]
MPVPVPKFAALKRSPFTWTSVGVFAVIFVALLMHQGLLSFIARRALASMAGASATGNFSSGTFSVSYVTAPNQDVAKKLATYEWKNEIQTDSEVLMVIKSRASRLDEMTKYVRDNHPYEVCEVISTPIQHGNPPYLKWISEVVPEAGDGSVTSGAGQAK